VVSAAKYGGQIMGLILNQWKLNRLHLFFFWSWRGLVGVV
jgi:hypothetical protein